MAATYEPISTQTLGSNTATVTFSSIPQTYTDLVLIANIKHSYGSTGIVRVEGLQFNSDTGSNYSDTFLDGDGSTASSYRYSNRTGLAIYGSQASESGYAINAIQIMNYANTTTYKTALNRVGYASSGNTVAIVDLWRSTSAISTINLSATSSYTFQTGSTFTLYGIKAA